MFKKIIVISLLLGSVILTGCSNNKKELELLKQQNDLLQKQVNEQEIQNDFFTKQTECKNICEKIYEEDKKQLPNDTVLNPTYVYNQEKNACFYAGGRISINPQGLTKRIINCQTNEEVLTYMEVNNKPFTNYCDTCTSSIQEYNQKLKEFIGE